MEGERNDCSTFSVPGAMSDVTIMSTPLPRATSTATKRILLLEESSRRVSSMERLVNEYDAMVDACWSEFPNSRPNYPPPPERQNDNISIVKSPNKSLGGNNPGSNIQRSKSPSKVNEVEQLSGTIPTDTGRKPYYVYNRNPEYQYTSSKDSQNKKTVSTTENEPFKIPAVPKSKPPGSKVNEVKKLFEADPTKSDTGNRRSMEIQKKKSRSSLDDYDQLDDCDSVKFPARLTKYQSFRDLAQQHDDRVSRSSSARSSNSSLGLISSDILHDASQEPLVDINQDLSLRLAQQLNLDTSLLKDGMDLSTLATERYKEKLAAKYENKENFRSSGSGGRWSSSDHFYSSIHGYSSDSSDSKNNTARRLSALSTGSEAGTSKMSTSSSRRSLQPLRENNISTPNFTSDGKRSTRSSLGSNPFGGYSNVSVCSEDFQFNEDAAERLAREEMRFSLASTRSLSGIYGDVGTSVNVGGEKLSISSFLRSRSCPLGSLETGASDAQSPEFGLPTSSPEKRGRARPILPPPQDKSTFVIDEEPVRDVPWAPESLAEQYSNIHGETEVDVSVPSLSYIGEMIDKMYKGADPKDIYAKLMGSQNATNSKSDQSKRVSRRISSIVEGEVSFCKGVEVEPSLAAKSVRDSVLDGPMEESVQSICNVTDFGGDGDEDPCVCVLTPQSMDFDIHNELPHPVEYTFASSCYVDGLREDAAAFVNIPVNKVMLYPGQKRTLTISIAALLQGVIKIKIEVYRRNPLTQERECSVVYGKIVAEVPLIRLMTNHKEEMLPGPNSDCDGKYQHTIVLKNVGRSTVPLNMTLIKVEDDDAEFYFEEKAKTSVNVTLEPGETHSQLVQCQPPPVFAHLAPPDTIIPVEAKVNFSLATTELYRLQPVNPISLTALLKPYFFGAPPTLSVPSILSLYNGSDQRVPFEVLTTPGYKVYPPSFTILPNNTFVVTVGTMEAQYPQRNETLTLSASYPGGTTSRYTIQLREDHRSSLSSDNSLATPHSSRATSPTSLSANHPELKVACSHKQLVWGGCCLHKSIVKSFCLKNKGQIREKLRLSTSGMCFQVLGEDGLPRPELKLSLQPTENREIKVAVLATVVGPQWGHLTISRIGQATDRNILPLFAFGGKSEVTIKEGVFEVKNEKYLVLEGNPMQGLFVLTNSGNNVAFFKISEASSKSSTGLVITPQEGVMAAGQSMTFHVGLSVTGQRLEYLLRQTSSCVRAAQLSVRWGDESTRQRLLRLRDLGGIMAARVAQLTHIPSAPIANLDKLNDPTDGAEELWEEDTEEWTVEVIVKRAALEALRLDVTQEFVDLSKSVSKPL